MSNVLSGKHVHIAPRDASRYVAAPGEWDSSQSFDWDHCAICQGILEQAFEQWYESSENASARRLLSEWVARKPAEDIVRESRKRISEESTAMSSIRELDRRQFLGAACLAFGAFEVCRPARLVAAVDRSQWFRGPARTDAVHDAILSSAESSFLLELLRGDRNTLHVLAGGPRANPDEVYPDDRAVSEEITTRLLGMPTHKDLPRLPQLLSGSVLGVASPTSIRLIAPLFGEENRLELPVWYKYEKEERPSGAGYYDQAGTWKIGTGGKGIVVRDQFFQVETQADKRNSLSTDYLVISVIPNPADPRARFALVAGAHGVATRSLLQVFENRILREWFFNCLADARHDRPFFQAWIKVLQIRHNHAKKVSTGKLSDARDDRGFIELPFGAILETAEALARQSRDES